MLHSRFVFVIALLASIVISEEVELASAAYGDEVVVQSPGFQDDGQDFVPDSSFPARPTYGGNTEWADSNTLRYGPPAPQYSVAVMPAEQFTAAVVPTYEPVRETHAGTTPAKRVRPRPAPRPMHQHRRPYRGQVVQRKDQPRRAPRARHNGVEDFQRAHRGRRPYAGPAPDNDYRPTRRQGNHKPKQHHRKTKAVRPRPKSSKGKRRPAPKRVAYGSKARWNAGYPIKNRKKKPKSTKRRPITEPVVSANYVHPSVVEQHEIEDISVQDEPVSIPTPIPFDAEEQNDDDTDLIALQNELEQPVPPITDQHDGATSLGKVNAAEATTLAPSDDETASPLEGANAGLI